MNLRKIWPLLMFALFLAIAALWIGPLILHLGDIPFHPNAKYSDLLTSHWPNAHFLRSAWLEWRSFPLWNPQILSGAPLVADPLFGIGYPPNWLAFIIPITCALNLIFWLHLGWAGFGMYCLARSEGVSQGSAIIAGALFSGMPKLIGHLALGHVGLISAVSWSPWALWSIRRSFEALPTDRIRLLRRSATSGVILGLVFLADVRWFLPLFGLSLLHAASLSIRDRMLKEVRLSRLILAVAICGIFSSGIAALQAIPLAEFALQSTRISLSAQELTSRSLNYGDLIGLLVPGYAGNPESLTYLSILGMGLALLGLLLGRGRWAYWAIVACIGLLLSLGGNTPLYPLLLNIVPGLRMMRVPARFFLLTSLAISLLAGMGLDGLLEGMHSPSTQRRMRLGMVGYGALLLLLAIGGGLLVTKEADLWAKPWIHMGLAAVGLLGLCLHVRRNVMKRSIQLLLWGFLLAVDLILVNHSLVEMRSSEKIFAGREAILVRLRSTPGSMRIFSPSYSIPQHIAAAYGLQLADGVNPLQLQAYWEYMAHAIGYPNLGYSVTLPPFPSGDPSAPQGLQVDAEALGLLNVGFVISEYPIDDAQLRLVTKIDGIYVYENPAVRPRAWMEQASDREEWQQVQSLSWSPNHIRITAQGEGRLVLSELQYPGWVAMVDGEQVPIEAYHGLLRSLTLSEGEHRIDFYFRPWTVYAGGLLTLAALGAFLLLWRHA